MGDWYCGYDAVDTFPTKGIVRYLDDNDAAISPTMSFIPDAALSMANSPSTNITTAASRFVPSLFKRERASAILANATTSNPTNCRIEPPGDRYTNPIPVHSNTRIAPPSFPIPTILNDTISATRYHQNGAVPGSFASTSSDFSSSAANSSSLLTTTETRMICKGYNGDDKRSLTSLECKSGDWHRLDEDFEEEETAAEDVEEEQKTALTLETPSPEPIQTHPDPRQTLYSICSHHQVKRKADDAAISYPVHDEDGAKHYYRIFTDDHETNYKLNNDSSSSEIQGPTMKKARMISCQGTNDKKWETMFQLLLKYKVQHGNTLVPSHYTQNPQLGVWVQAQRSLHSNKQLASHRVLQLESIEFVWFSNLLLMQGQQWGSMFQLLVKYKAQHGDTRVPQKTCKIPGLGHWVNRQRCLHSKKRLAADRVFFLESIGFQWRLQKPQGGWKSMFQLLLEYKGQHGNTLVPSRYSQHLQLGVWVQTQKSLYSKKQLRKDRVLQLESIGFVWSSHRLLMQGQRWESMFQLLVKYKAQHGNTMVPPLCPKNLQLGKWVVTQRRQYSKNQLSSNRVLRLESIGFEWSSKRLLLAGEQWESQFQQLLEYKAQHGHTCVPLRYPKNPKLGWWVQSQRARHAKKLLKVDRFLKLDSLGFVWSFFKKVLWEPTFQLLLEYKAQNGNTHVPRSYKNPELAFWVSRQRQLYAKNNLPKYRILRLESIGFLW